MRQYFFYVILLSIFAAFADTEPDSFSQEAQERKKYLDPGIGVQDQFTNPAFTQEFCEFVLSTAPAEILEKIKLINNPFCPDELRPRRIILVGPSGSGKTTLAQIIGYYSLRPMVYINAGMLGNEFKNSAVQNLRRAIEPYINSSCVVILDEIDCLLKQSQHDRNPDIDLPKQIWEMFDICSQYPQVTLIGITNDIGGMPDPLKTRLSGDIIEVPMIDSLERRKMIIEFYMNRTPNSCSTTDLATIAQSSKDFSHRELEKVIKEAHGYAFLRDQFCTKIKISDFDKAFEKIRKNRKLLNKINWKDYEKHFQYGIQISGVLVSCIGIAVSAYMAYLSLKVSKDAYVVGKDGLEHSKQHAQVTIAKSDDQFKKNQAMTFFIATQGHLSQKIQAMAHTRWRQYENGNGFLKLETETIDDPANPGKQISRYTPFSQAVVKYFDQGNDALSRWGQVGMTKLVEEEIEKLLKQQK